MPRIGTNPARGHVSEYKPSRVTLCMLTYLPEESGYFRDRLEVIKLSLASLMATAPNCDLLVFDNGSANELVDHLRGLRDAGSIRYLLLSSANIGKIGALKIMYRAAPGELIAYGDDDMYYVPGWLEESLRVIDAYPGVGMVSGFYARPQMKYGIESTLRFAAGPDVQVQRGRLLEERWERHFVDNYGRDWQAYADSVADVQDMLLTVDGVPAYVSAQHMQYVAPKQVLLEALPAEWGGQLMGQMRELDCAVDRLGYLRLSTREPLTRFIGNLIGPEMAAEAAGHGLQAKLVARKKKRHPLNFILRSGRVTKWLWEFYGNLFEFLNSRGPGK